MIPLFLILLLSVIPSSLHFLLLFFTSYSLHPIYPLPPLPFAFLCSCPCPPLLLFAYLVWFPFVPRCWPPAGVFVCVCPCAWPDLPEQRAPARLFTPRRRRRREQQRHAGHRGWSSVVRAAVPCHQLPLVCVWISVRQHERWERKLDAQSLHYTVCQLQERIGNIYEFWSPGWTLCAWPVIRLWDKVKYLKYSKRKCTVPVQCSFPSF